MKKVLFLWSDFTGYMQNVASALSKYGHKVTVLHWSYTGNKNELSDDIVYVDSEKLKIADIIKLIRDLSPDLVVVCGWMDLRYIFSLWKNKRSGGNFKVVSGYDDQWHGNLRQYIGTFVFRIFFKKLLKYAWISGRRQYMYARKFGYDDRRIIFNLYCGQFNGIKKSSNVEKKRFLYIGRLIDSKGLKLLIEAHNQLSDSIRNEWPLVIVGDGPLNKVIPIDPCIIYLGKLSGDRLALILSEGGIGCVPSSLEQWGVVIHEYTQFGLPVVCSDVCGAASDLVIDGYNGRLFRSGEVNSLYSILNYFTKMRKSELIKYSEASLLSSSNYSIEKSVYSLMSVMIGEENEI